MKQMIWMRMTLLTLTMRRWFNVRKEMFKASHIRVVPLLQLSHNPLNPQLQVIIHGFYSSLTLFFIKDYFNWFCSVLFAVRKSKTVASKPSAQERVHVRRKNATEAFPSIKFRGGLEVFTTAISKMNSAQRKAVEAIGFGTLLKLQDITIPK